MKSTEEINQISGKIVNCAYTVHHSLGPGLLENVYEVCLAHELEKRGLKVERQVILPVVYDNLRLDAALRLDMLVENAVVIELKLLKPSHSYTRPS